MDYSRWLWTLSPNAEGDLTLFDVQLFEKFVQQNSSAPFLAYIALSTNHAPHYARRSGFEPKSVLEEWCLDSRLLLA